MGTDGCDKYDKTKRESSSILTEHGIIAFLFCSVTVTLLMLLNLGPYQYSAPRRHGPFAPKFDATSRIPMVVHLSYGKQRPKHFDSNVLSWKALNPGWQVQLYDEATIAQYVKERFPQHTSTMRRLANDAERANLFRYLVLLGDGGVYAEGDVRCLRPLDEVLPPDHAGLVLGWDSDAVPQEQCEAQHHARSMQVQKWTLASVKGHPVMEIMVNIVHSAVNNTMHPHPLRNVMVRSGVAALTDTALRYQTTQTAQEAARWPVHILPAAVWGTVHGTNGPTALTAAEHQPSSTSWTTRATSWAAHKGLPFGSCRAHGMERWPVTVVPPVGVLYGPTRALTIMVDVPWRSTTAHITGAPEGGANPALHLQGYGVWFPGMHPTDAPTPLDVLALLLDGITESHPRAVEGSKHTSLLLDVGAGYGLHTLAAAALGHRVVALTDARQRSHAALMQSLQVNQHINGGVTVLPVQAQQALLLNISALRSGSHTSVKTTVQHSDNHKTSNTPAATTGSAWGTTLGVLKPKKWLHKGLLDTLWHRRKRGGSDDADAARRGAAVVGLAEKLDMGSTTVDDGNSTNGGAHNSTKKHATIITDDALLHSARRQLGWPTRVASEASFTVLDLAVGARRLLHRQPLPAHQDTAGKSKPNATQTQQQQQQHVVSSHALPNNPPEAVLASIRPTVVRLGAHGWEPHLFDSMLQAWAALNTSAASLPHAVLAAWDTDRMHAVGMNPGRLLRKLAALGYTRAVQAVTACCLPSNHTTVLAAAIAMHAGPFGSRKATVNWCDVPVTSVQALLAPSSFGHSLRHVVFVHQQSPLADASTNAHHVTFCEGAPAHHPLVPVPWAGNHRAVHVEDGITWSADPLAA